MTRDYVLILDDDICWEEQLQKELSRAGIYLEEAENLTALYEKLESAQQYLAIILSLDQLKQEQTNCSLPEFLREQKIPIYFLDTHEEICQEIMAFEEGAADYFWKEKDIRAIAVRILTGIHVKKKGIAKLEYEIRVDMAAQTVYIQDIPVFLTKLEFQVFHLLWKERGTVVDRGEIYQKIWQDKNTKNMRVVDTIVKQLRHKLKGTRLVILSKHKLGYLLIFDVKKQY